MLQFEQIGMLGSMKILFMTELVVLVLAMQTNRAVEAQLCSFLTFALGRGEWPVSWSSLILPQGKCLQYPLSRRLGGTQSQFGEERNLMLLPGIKPYFLGLPAHSLVTVPTELLHLLIDHPSIKHLMFTNSWCTSVWLQVQAVYLWGTPEELWKLGVCS